MTLNRFSNFTFSAQDINTKNRVVVPPMASQTADEGGFVTSATIEHYQRLAASDAGIVFVEYSYVHRSGKGEARQLAIDSRDKLLGLAKLANVIRNAGALPGIQLVHVGGKSQREITGEDLQSPSGILVPVKGWVPDASRAVNDLEILQWVDWFQSAANIAYEAGFDIVELHAAHGYGLNQWISPLTNQRKDLYGGNLENRIRILLEIVREIKRKNPQFLLAARIPGQDHLEGGLTVNDMQIVVGRLEEAGLDLLDVSSGIGGWRRPDGKAGQGYLVDDAKYLREKSKLPVIGVGGIEKGEFIDQLLQAYQVDFAAVGRAILKDPRAWKERELMEEIG